MSGEQQKTLSPASPFFVSLNVDPRVGLRMCKLQGDVNYNTWSKVVLNALKAKNKQGFVLGTIKEPEKGTLESEA